MTYIWWEFGVNSWCSNKKRVVPDYRFTNVWKDFEPITSNSCFLAGAGIIAFLQARVNVYGIVWGYIYPEFDPWFDSKFKGEKKDNLDIIKII